MMDVRTVVKMLEDLKIGINEHITNKVEEQARKVSEEDTILKLTSRINVQEAKERMLIGTMSTMADKIKELQEKIEYQDRQNARRMFVLTGFEGSEKKYICRKQVKWFIQDVMDIEANVEDIFWIGKATPP